MKSRICICRSLLSFTAGFALGQVYYNYLLKTLPFSKYWGIICSYFISLVLGVLNVISVQVRCISLLCLPIYCGKVGRGVLKAVVLTYIVTGPIVNLSLNAKEVVRVFACSTELSYNISILKYELTTGPLRNTALSLKTEVERTKDTFRYLRNIINPITNEIEGTDEFMISEINEYLDYYMDETPTIMNTNKEVVLRNYMNKLRYRCEDQLSEAVETCNEVMISAYNNCCQASHNSAYWMLCWPLKSSNICNFLLILDGNKTCDVTKQINIIVVESYFLLKNVFQEIMSNINNIHLQYKITMEQDLYDVQDAKETGKRVLHAFEEKTLIMRSAIVIMNLCMAILFIRIVVAAVTYHDLYLTRITYDNIYITGYFKALDERRKENNEFTLLPLKKMERIKYKDVNSLTYITIERGKLLTQILKVMLEAVTATTFVMLDRLFYEALDVVRQHAVDGIAQQHSDLDIEIKGGGILATILRKLIKNIEALNVRPALNSEECLPRPRLMPTEFFIKIYGGYLWILLLVFLNPYTLRLRRLVCSYFYKRREKQRILYLYNDILKKRMKMDKTVRRQAVQAVRAHYLSGENLLSLRIKYPQLLSWLKVFPAARMTCLICGETQPRRETPNTWHSCAVSKCPFVYCSECWCEIGARCMACDPSLAELSDIDSLSDEEHAGY